MVTPLKKIPRSGACETSPVQSTVQSRELPRALILEKCKTLRGEPELIMSCTHDSLKFLGAKWNLLNNK